MSKCFSRWQGYMKIDGSYNIKCRTCELRLKDGQIAASCGLPGFYSRRNAVRMGSLNSMIWELRNKLSNYQQQLKNANKVEPLPIVAINRTMKTYRSRILELMREKRNPEKYADLIEWDETLKRNENQI